MSQIFISYRREDSAGYAGRLGEALERRLGDGAVFRDVDALQPGQDFVDAIAVRLRDAGVCLVLIGREWLDTRGRSGRRRLEEQNDYVLHEIATALARPDLLVIPVLVEGTRMPATEELPEPIQALARRHAASLRDESWDADVDRLVNVVRKATGSQGAADAVRLWVRRHLVPLAGFAAVALVALLLAARWSPQVSSELDRTADISPETGGVPAPASTTVPVLEEKPPEPTPPREEVPNPVRGGRAALSPNGRAPVRASRPAENSEPPTAPPRTVPPSEPAVVNSPAALRANAEVPTGPGRESGEPERPTPSPAPPVPAAPAAGSTAVTPPPVITASALVKKVIADYERAAEALDVDGVRRVWPAAPDGLRNSYRNLVSQSIDLNCAEPTVSSDTATIACREQIRSVGAGRIALPVATNTATFSLRRNGEAWEISRISRQSAP